MGTILIFYKYVHIADPNIVMRWQKTLCQNLNLTGRIILAHEGINATLAGSPEAIALYRESMGQHPLFTHIDFKESPGNTDCFPRLRIVVKNEIVNFGVDPNVVTVKDTGEHLKPAQAHALMARKNSDMVLLDTRNNYESRIGTFTNAIIPDINHFRELPEYIDNNLEQFKDKEVIMFCTAGVRCERASAYLNLKGVAKKVYQVEGGIHRYIEEFPDGFFRGKNYVFDGRVTVKVNDDILGSCALCQKPCDDYNNCLNASCNKHFIGCINCVQQYNNSCSAQCLELLATNQVKARPLFKRYAQQ